MLYHIRFIFTTFLHLSENADRTRYCHLQAALFFIRIKSSQWRHLGTILPYFALYLFNAVHVIRMKYTGNMFVSEYDEKHRFDPQIFSIRRISVVK